MRRLVKSQGTARPVGWWLNLSYYWFSQVPGRHTDAAAGSMQRASAIAGATDDHDGSGYRAMI